VPLLILIALFDTREIMRREKFKLTWASAFILLFVANYSRGYRPDAWLTAFLQGLVVAMLGSFILGWLLPFLLSFVTGDREPPQSSD
jgi:hypothetical protein